MTLPKPQALKILDGTARKDRPPVEELGAPFEPLDTLPEGPSWLPNEHAREEYQRIGSLMIRGEMLHDGNLGLLETVAAWRGRMVQSLNAGNTPKAADMRVLLDAYKQLGITKPAGSGDGGKRPNRFSQFRT